MRKVFGKVGIAFIYLFLTTWVFLQLYPVLYMFLSAFKTDMEIATKPYGFPSGLYLDNFKQVWRGGNVNVSFGNYFLNSCVITAGTLILLSIVSLLCGYALSRYKFKGSGIIYKGMVSLIAIPVHALLIPIYTFSRNLGLLNNRGIVILIYTALWLPFSVVIMRSYFESVPKSLEEAARIDGCSELMVFGKVAVPVARNAVVTLIIINIVGIWSELMFASVLLTKPLMRTLPIGISMFQGGMYSSSVAWLMASLSIATFPLLVVYFVFQKQIMKGMAAGAVKS